ncbi:36K protein [morning glory varicosavirus]|uniref:36K protein n=1 Tax=morning glory varicosavirus TaxID=2946038 RepID=UPI00248343C3|nr:36K protein [morning glory varicosavirus]UQZ09619.1 36K protein [morning glory varicosavirus]
MEPRRSLTSLYGATRQPAGLTQNRNLQPLTPATQNMVVSLNNRLLRSASTSTPGPLETHVLNKHSESSLNREKVSYYHKMQWRPKGQNSVREIGNITITDVFKTLRWPTGALTEPEIVMVYRPNLPVELYRNQMTSIILYFTAGEEEEQVISVARFSSSLPVQVSMCPGHSVSISLGAKLPWKIEIVTDAEVKENYILADVTLELRAYNSSTSQYCAKRDALVTSLAPLYERPIGSTSYAGIGGGNITIPIQQGIKTRSELDAIGKLKELGINTDGLRMLKLLDKAVKAVRMHMGSPSEDQDGLIIQEVNKILAAKPKYLNN